MFQTWEEVTAKWYGSYNKGGARFLTEDFLKEVWDSADEHGLRRALNQVNSDLLKDTRNLVIDECIAALPSIVPVNYDSAGNKLTNFEVGQKLSYNAAIRATIKNLEALKKDL